MSVPFCLLCGRKKKPNDVLYGSDCISKVEGKSLGDVLPIKLTQSKLEMVCKDNDTPEIILTSLMLDPSVSILSKRKLAMNPSTPENMLNHYVDNVKDPYSKFYIYANKKCPKKYIDEFIDLGYKADHFKNFQNYAIHNASEDQKLALIKKDKDFIFFVAQTNNLNEETIDIILDSKEPDNKLLLANHKNLSNDHFLKLLNEKNSQINKQLIANSSLPKELINKLYFESNDEAKLGLISFIPFNENCPLNILEDSINLSEKNGAIDRASEYLMTHPNLSESLHTTLLNNAANITIRKKGLRADTTSRNLIHLEKIIENDGYLKQTNMKEEIKAHPNYKQSASFILDSILNGSKN